MRHDSVILKSNAHGLILMLDPDIPFEELKRDVGEKFRESARFFKNAQMAVAFRGRGLSAAEERQLVYAITENSQLHIVCVIDEQAESGERFRQAVIRSLEQDVENTGEFYRGTLRAGQVLETEHSVIILGDVNPGAQVISRGNIIVLGCCMGMLYAGASGNSRCFAAALVLKPKKLRIADKTVVSAITKTTDDGQYAADPMIARIRDGHLKIEPLNGRAFETADVEEETGE